MLRCRLWCCFQYFGECHAVREEWEAERQQLTGEEEWGFSESGIPIDCPILQGEVRAPWEEVGDE